MGGGRDRQSGGMEGRTEREDGAKVGENHTENKRETEIHRDTHTERDTEKRHPETETAPNTETETEIESWRQREKH